MSTPNDVVTFLQARKNDILKFETKMNEMFT